MGQIPKIFKPILKWFPLIRLPEKSKAFEVVLGVNSRKFPLIRLPEKSKDYDPPILPRERDMFPLIRLPEKSKAIAAIAAIAGESSFH